MCTNQNHHFFQLQMTGYVFRSVERRLSLQSSLSNVPTLILKGEQLDEPVIKPTISGKIKVSYESGAQIEVTAEAYMGELKARVEQLEADNKKLKEQQLLESDLLKYIKSMSAEQYRPLTENISQEVLEGMQILINTVFSSMGAPPESWGMVVYQQTNSNMAQVTVCVWFTK